jgi:hypothetical protein
MNPGENYMLSGMNSDFIRQATLGAFVKGSDKSGHSMNPGEYYLSDLLRDFVLSCFRDNYLFSFP